MSWSELECLLRASPAELTELRAQAAQLWQGWSPAERERAAALALSRGFPSLALAALTGEEVGEQGRLTQAAALLRLGRSAEVLALRPALGQGARSAVLLARALWQEGQESAADQALQARRQARLEGDAGALIAAAVLVAETELGHSHQALRSLAEGLKVAELTGEEADAHVLALLSEVQRRLGGVSKAQRTAQKALDRAAPRSPARVIALLTLGQQEAAWAETQAGELSPVWWSRWSPSDRPPQRERAIPL